MMLVSGVGLLTELILKGEVCLRQFKKCISMVLVFVLIIASVSGVQTTVVHGAASDLFFSEYIEGSSFNKILEIYNGTGSAADLSEYTVELYSNGADEATYSIGLSGTLENKDVYIIANNAVAEVIKGQEDLVDLYSAGVANFNGDDAVVLKRDGAVIDSIGQVGFRPQNPAKWGSGSTSTLDCTLVRKSSVVQGDSNDKDEFDPSDEWIGYPKDYFDDLGIHHMDGSGGGTDPEKVSSVTAEPRPGRVERGTEVSLFTATEEATVYYTVYYAAYAPDYPDAGFQVFNENEPIIVNEPLTIKAYAAKEGLEDSDISEFEYTLVEEAQKTSIAEAKELILGTKVLVEGKVNTVPGSFGTQSFYIQDETAGALVFTSSLDSVPVIGNTVRVEGKTDEYNGKFEIVPEKIQIIDNGTIEPDAKTVSLSGVNEENEGLLIKLRAAEIIDISSDSYKSVYITVQDGINEATVKLDNRTGETSEDVTVKIGEYIDVTGVVEQSKASPAEYRVMIRSLEDVDTAEVISISAARALPEDSNVVIQGVVTSKPGSFGQKSFYIQDSTSGALVFTNTIDSAVTRGSRLLITGKTDTYAGKFEIVPSGVEILSEESKEPDPKVISIAGIEEGNEAVLVRLEDVKVNSITGDSYYNAAITISKGNEAGTLRLDSRTGYSYNDLIVKEGDIVHITGIVEQGRETPAEYRVALRDLDDIEASENDDKEAPVIIHTALTDGNINTDLAISAEVTDNIQIASVKLHYRIKGSGEYNIIDMSGVNNLYSAAIPKAQLSISGIEYYIEAFDGINSTTSPDNIAFPYEVNISDDDIVGPEITNVIPANNAVLSDTEVRPEIIISYIDNSGIDTNNIKLLVDGLDVTDKAIIQQEGIYYKPSQDLLLGKHNASVEIKDVLGNKTEYHWTFNIGETEYNHYYGQLHSHTGEISDGQGTLDQAYTWARDNGKADFFAVTDHSNWFENDMDNEDITDISQSTSTKWKLMNSKADQYNEDGMFVAIAGYEMTWSGSTGGWGHINTFNTPWFASRSNSSMDLPAYYEKIASDSDSISQFNHPGKTFGDFADFGFYSQAVDNVVKLIEVGNGEGPVHEKGYFPSYEYYTRALDKGWHVAPSNNQDNHKAGWITSNDARTVVLSEELTRESIYEAIRSLRVYSTEDKNMEVMYKVNDCVMGSILDTPEKLDIYISVKDPDEEDVIDKISIISNGGVEVASKAFDDNEALWELELDPQYSYYYIRVDQEDRDIAVTSPVWTDEVVPVGISKVEVSQDPQIVNNPVEISATVYNNGMSPLENVKVEFYKDSIEAGNKIGEGVVDSIGVGAEGKASIEWTSDKVGQYNLYAQTTISISGVEKVFSASTTAAFANLEDVTKIVLDRAHYNAYISGDYADKDMTLREIFKERKYMLVENNDELTAADLENAKLLIITDPQSTDKSDTLKKSVFTDAEVAAIKGYMNNGGSLIICSKADYKDGTGEYSNGAQLNKILEAIGTNLRVNDDEVVDDVSNGGQSYRLYFDRYTSDKYGLTDNIPEGTTYSFYSGCSVILKDGGDEEAVDWLVKGHETTGTFDSDEHGDHTPVQQGNVNAIGAELMSNNAKIIVAGTIFFSDFETESGDDAYSNKQITENILDWMIPAEEVEVKTIAEVRADKNNDGIPDNMGKRFAVEGRVTSQSEAVIPKNAFFEVIYVQDETGGITVFGVSTTPLPLGTKVRITGVVDQYDGDAELSVENETNDVIILSDDIQLVEPMLMNTGNSMIEQNEGWLVKVQGIVTRMTENSLYLDDGSGEARVYVNGYISDGTDNEEMRGKWDPKIKVNDTVSAIGLASEDPEGHRLRVRNTAEIVRLGSAVTGVILDKTEAAINVNESVALTATVQPEDAFNRKVSWSSSDSSIASVVNGVVTGVSAGTAVITVSTEEGDYKAACEVTVEGVQAEYTLSIGNENTGGAGRTREITIGGTGADSLDGKYIVVQFTEGEGTDAKVSVIMISLTDNKAIISYQNTGTAVEVWLTSGMPNLTEQDMGVEVYAHGAAIN